LLTVLGYVNAEGPLTVSSTFKHDKQQVLGLYYDDASKDK